MSIKALISLIILDTKTDSAAGAVGREQVTSRILKDQGYNEIYLLDGESEAVHKFTYFELVKIVTVHRARSVSL